MVFIGIDLGGTNIKGVLVDAGEVLKQHYIPTHDDPDGLWRENVRDMVGCLQRFWRGPIEAVGLSAPGLPDAANQSIAFMPDRLPGLENFQWGVPGPTYLHSQRRPLGADGQGYLWSGQGYKNVVLLTLGTGIGGGLLINGELYRRVIPNGGAPGSYHRPWPRTTTSVASWVPGWPGDAAVGNYSVERRSQGSTPRPGNWWNPTARASRLPPTFGWLRSRRWR